MKNTIKLLTLGAILLVSACSTVTKDIEIETEADPKTSFDGYQSYTWLASSEIVFDPDGQWEPKGMDVDSEVRFVINENLRKRGMLEVSENADMYVVFSAGVDMAALGVEEDPKSKEQMLVNMPMAGLSVGFIDADTGYLIWRGVAVGDAAGDRSLEEMRKRIEYAVKKMFKQIP